MRVLVLSDIHSNLEALGAVLDHAQGMGGFQRVWCLGDTVGYGPDPGPCIDLLRGHDALCVAGNHDLAVAGKMDTRDFNPYAAEACAWTAGQLAQEQRQYLGQLPLVLQEERATLVHGSLRDPVWEYMVTAEAALATIALCQTPLCLVGHSHIPFVWSKEQGFRHLNGDGDTVSVGGEGRLILNPGSVGQPRDGDPQASYMLLDTSSEVAYHHRVPYLVGDTQAKMRRAGLPSPLIERLTHGR